MRHGTAGGVRPVGIVPLTTVRRGAGAVAERLERFGGTGGRVLVAGNLPYSVAQAILARLLAAHAALDQATVMLQREVGERLAAEPGSRAYGAPTVLWRLWADVRLLLVVPPEAFRPPPAVESAVVQATFRAAPGLSA